MFDARPTCLRCRRPASVCYCSFLTSISTRTRILLLQHPRERDVAIGTARLASLCLPNAELHIGIDWTDSPAVQAALCDPARPAALLYPGENAIDVSVATRDSADNPITLVVIDGTWPMTRKVVRLNPQLEALPRISFTPPVPSEYRIRREPRAAFVSTLEALVHVLGYLEGDPERFQALMQPFRAMIDMQIDHETRLHTPWSRQKPLRQLEAPGSSSLAGLSQGDAPRGRAGGEIPGDQVAQLPGDPAAPPPARPGARGHLDSTLPPPGYPPARLLARLPAGLQERQEDLVCISLEANAWPARSSAGRPDQLVYLLAERPGGERLEALIAPRSPLNPATPFHTGLVLEELLAGLDWTTFVRRWRAFMRDTDLLCAWGDYAFTLLEREGLPLPAGRIDLRRTMGDLLRGPPGMMTQCLERLGLEAAPGWGRGRGGERHGQLMALTGKLWDASQPLSRLVETPLYPNT